MTVEGKTRLPPVGHILFFLEILKTWGGGWCPVVVGSASERESHLVRVSCEVANKKVIWRMRPRQQQRRARLMRSTTQLPSRFCKTPTDAVSGHGRSTTRIRHARALAEISREHFPRGIVARMSATSRACGARGIWRTTRHTDKRAALHRSRPPADQSDKRVEAERGSRPTHRLSSRGNCFCRI